MRRQKLEEMKIPFKAPIIIKYYDGASFSTNYVGCVSGPRGDSLSYCFLDKGGSISDVPSPPIALKDIRRVLIKRGR